MGQVYKARDLRLSREVALKIVRSDVPSDKERLHRFADEAKAASLLSHPNIVAVYDIGDKDGSPYIISELLQGETLRDRLATGPLPARKAVDYGLQTLRGLAAAHEKGIIHRDLKPENLFLTKDGLVKILDFGIAKLGRQGEEPAGTDIETLSHTAPGTLIGTVGYMSPEQVRGLAVDHRSDLFSFGAVLFEMLVGKRGFKGTTVADTLSAILREDPTEAAGSGPGIPPGFVRVVRRSLEKSPDDRFQTARDLAFALEGATTEASITVTSSGSPLRGRDPRLRTGALALAAVVAAAGLGVWFGHRTAPSPSPPSFQRLTFFRGQVQSARFAPDGETILYSAKWGNRPTEVFSTRANTKGRQRALGVTDALVLAISPGEEMALLLRPRQFAIGVFEGTLARAPLAGGAPREILEGVIAADWSPDGKDIAVVHVVGGDRYRLEYPIGHVLYAPDPPVWLSDLRVSPSGDTIAVQEHPVPGDNQGGVVILDRNGRLSARATGFANVGGACWSPSREEVWFNASRTGRVIPQQIRALSLSGRQRLVAEQLGSVGIVDVSRAGQVLVVNTIGDSEIWARARGASEEAELPAADFSFLSDLSDDGKYVLGTDTGEGGGPNFSFYIQGTDGSPAVWLGEGDGQALSPDGRFALAVLTHAEPQRLIVVPVGAGETRTLDPGDILQYRRAVWDNTGRRVVFSGVDKQNSLRVYVQDLEGGPPKAVTPDDVGLDKVGRPVSPDGRRVVAIGSDGVPALYPLAGGEPVAVPGLGVGDVTLCWTPDGSALMVARYEESQDAPPRIQRVEVTNGRTRPWNRIQRAAPAGLQSTRILLTPDGESYAYSYLRAQIDLYITSKLQ
jgi:tRNA A-37 threonylcarbamoyl transferase component Bud32/Tol biopolymer transport system component